MSHPQVPTPEMDDWQSFLDMETDTDSTASTHEIYLSNSNAVMVSQSASIPDFSDPDDRSLSPLSNRSRAVLLPATSSTTDRGRTPNNSPVSVHRTLKLQEDNGLSISYPGRRENTSLKRPLESEEGKDCCRHDHSTTHRAKRVRSHSFIPSNSVVHTELSSWVEIKTQLEACMKTLCQLGAKVDDVIRTIQQ